MTKSPENTKESLTLTNFLSLTQQDAITHNIKLIMKTLIHQDIETHDMKVKDGRKAYS